MEDVIRLPVTEERAAGKKRARPPNMKPEEEDTKRRSNARNVAALGAEDGAVKLLEELLFGAEEELLDRLVEVCETL